MNDIANLGLGSSSANRCARLRSRPWNWSRPPLARIRAHDGVLSSPLHHRIRGTGAAGRRARPRFAVGRGPRARSAAWRRAAWRSREAQPSRCAAAAPRPAASCWPTGCPRPTPPSPRGCAAGALFIGKTNMHEFAWGGTSANLHYGAVCATRGHRSLSGRLQRRLGGAVAARFCASAPSAPTPAARSGCPRPSTAPSGLRPTYGRVSNHGVIPLA